MTTGEQFPKPVQVEDISVREERKLNSPEASPKAPMQKQEVPEQPLPERVLAYGASRLKLPAMEAGILHSVINLLDTEDTLKFLRSCSTVFATFESLPPHPANVQNAMEQDDVFKLLAKTVKIVENPETLSVVEKRAQSIAQQEPEASKKMLEMSAVLRNQVLRAKLYLASRLGEVPENGN